MCAIGLLKTILTTICIGMPLTDCYVCCEVELWLSNKMTTELIGLN